jgi:hypothetical protein
VLYWIKIALPSTAPVRTQAKVLVETANAMVRVQSLPKAPEALAMRPPNDR